MARIKVEETGDWLFKVAVSDATGRTVHQVTLNEGFAGKMNLSPEEVVKKSFEFLLERESKEAILSSFSIPATINHYFPEFQNEMMEN
jgi:hypothetical protein